MSINSGTGLAPYMPLTNLCAANITIQMMENTSHFRPIASNKFTDFLTHLTIPPYQYRSQSSRTHIIIPLKRVVVAVQRTSPASQFGPGPKDRFKLGQVQRIGIGPVCTTPGCIERTAVFRSNLIVLVVHVEFMTVTSHIEFWLFNIS